MSKVGKNELLDSAKGILAGTSNVLYAFDNFEIRKIINCARLCSLKAYIIKMESANFQPQQMVQCLMQISQVIVQLAQLTNKRITELLTPVLQQRLKTAVDEITRESPLLITSSKALLQSSNNPYIKVSRNLSCDRLMDICMEIEIVVQIIIDDDRQGAFGASSEVDTEFQSLIRECRALGIKMVSFAEGEKTEDMKKALDAYLTASSILQKKAREFIAQIKERKTKKALQEILDKQLLEEAKVKDLTRELEVDPKDSEKKLQLAHATNNSDKCRNQFADKKVLIYCVNKQSEYENSFSHLLFLSNEHGRKMVKSALSSDLPAAKKAQEGYFGATKKLKQRSLEYMETNKDPKVRKTIQKILTTLEDDENKIQVLSSQLLESPVEKTTVSELATKLAVSSKNWAAIDAANSQGV